MGTLTTSNIPITQTATDTEMIGSSKTHTETETKKNFFKTDTI